MGGIKERRNMAQVKIEDINKLLDLALKVNTETENEVIMRMNKIPKTSVVSIIVYEGPFEPRKEPKINHVIFLNDESEYDCEKYVEARDCLKELLERK